MFIYSHKYYSYNHDKQIRSAKEAIIQSGPVEGLLGAQDGEEVSGVSSPATSTHHRNPVRRTSV